MSFFLNHHRSSASLYQLKDYICGGALRLKMDAITMTNEMNETISNLYKHKCVGGLFSL